MAHLDEIHRNRQNRPVEGRAKAGLRSMLERRPSRKSGKKCSLTTAMCLSETRTRLGEIQQQHTPRNLTPTHNRAPNAAQEMQTLDSVSSLCKDA